MTNNGILLSGGGQCPNSASFAADILFPILASVIGRGAVFVLNARRRGKRMHNKNGLHVKGLIVLLAVMHMSKNGVRSGVCREVR
jgi:hypothetical protein